MRKTCKTLLCIAALICTSSQHCLAQNPREFVNRVSSKDIAVDIVALTHTDDTDAAMDFCREGIASIPLPIQRKVAAAGIQVVISPRTIYDDPEKSGEKVFTNGGTFDNAGGFFQSTKNRVLIPERAAWRNNPPRFQGRYIIKVVRHELGHAFDHASGSISRQADYMQAYKEDLSRLSSDQKIKFAYFINGTSKEKSEDGTPSGRAELFAQMICALCTKPPTEKDAEMLASFSHVKNFLFDLEPGLKDVPVANTQLERRVGKTERTSSSSVSSESAGASESKTENPDVDKAFNLIQAKQYREALILLNGVIKANPADERAHILRGNDLSWMGRYQDALWDYNAAIRLNRQSAEAYMMRARAYGWLGRRLDQEHDDETVKRIQSGQQIGGQK